MWRIEQQRKVSAHAEVSRNLLSNALSPFSQSMAHKILSKDRVGTNKNVKRERGRESGRWGKVGEGEEKRERERERERERGRQGNVYNSCSFCHNVFSKRGSSEETNSGMETLKIHIKTIE